MNDYKIIEKSVDASFYLIVAVVVISALLLLTHFDNRLDKIEDLIEQTQN